MRKILEPRTNEQDRIYSHPKETEIFKYGIVKDVPASDIPDTSLADGFNVIPYPTEIIGRAGSELYTLLEIPPIPGKTGITAYKSGNIIISTTNVFEISDISNFFVWPGDEPEHDEIIEFISPYRIKVSISNNKSLIVGCYIRGKNNLFEFHKQRKLWVRQFGNLFYHSELPMAEWNENLVVSRDLPSNAKSDYQDFDDYSGVAFNSGGIFHIDFEVYPYPAYRINIPVPDITIANKPIENVTVKNPYSYRYLYSASRLSGNGVLRSRLNPIRIEMETGTNTEDKETINAGLDKHWLDNSISEEDSNIIGPLWVPKVENTYPQEYQWHLTHFPIWRTLDLSFTYSQLGEADDTGRGYYNNPDRFVWVHDLRICGAFYAKKENGIIIAEEGKFEVADVGSVIEWEDGERDEILDYIDENRVIYARLGEYDYIADRPLRAAAIGNGRVMRASQVGNIVTRTHGSTFVSDDERKTIHWADGYRSYIKEFLNENEVMVYEEFEHDVQGCTLDPRYRYFNDTVTDRQLRARMTTLLLRNRFWEPLPNANIGILPPGFMVVAIRNFGEVYYSQMPENYEYLAGFHNRAIQVSKVMKDDIQAMYVFPDKFVVWTSSKTFHVPTNLAEFSEVPEIGEAVAILPGADILDPDKGLFNWGSLQPTGNGEVMLLTSEPGFVGRRRFNGTSYGPDENFLEEYGQGRMSQDINNMYNATASIYNAISGYIVWGKEKNG